MREAISPELRAFVLKRDRNTCRYCGTKNTLFHMDHVYPVAKGGETSAENLVTSCARCNAKKHTKIMFPKPIGYFEEQKIVPLFAVLMLVLGIGLVASGFMLILMPEYRMSGLWSVLIGIIIDLIGLGKVLEGVRT